MRIIAKKKDYNSDPEENLMDDRNNEQLQRCKRKLQDIRRTITYQENGSFITINRLDFVNLTNQACVDTIDAHGNKVDEGWMNSFRKRFWGSLKTLDHNRQQTTMCEPETTQRPKGWRSMS